MRSRGHQLQQAVEEAVDAPAPAQPDDQQDDGEQQREDEQHDDLGQQEGQPGARGAPDPATRALQPALVGRHQEVAQQAAGALEQARVPGSGLGREREVAGAGVGVELAPQDGFLPEAGGASLHEPELGQQARAHPRPGAGVRAGDVGAGDGSLERDLAQDRLGRDVRERQDGCAPLDPVAGRQGALLDRLAVDERALALADEQELGRGVPQVELVGVAAGQRDLAARPSDARQAGRQGLPAGRAPLRDLQGPACHPGMDTPPAARLHARPERLARVVPAPPRGYRGPAPSPEDTMPIPTWIPILLTALAPQSGSQPAAGIEQWQALPLPSLAVRPPSAPLPGLLLEGHHLLLPGEDLEAHVPPPGASLPVPALLGLLQEDAAQRRKVLRLQPDAPPLLARGDAESLASARAILEDLDRQGQGLEIEVSAWWTPGAPAVGTHPSREVVEAAVAGARPLGTALLRSGGAALLGERRARDFVAGYTVEIASGSGVAGPALGRILEGRSLYLRASRVHDGGGIALEGFLDVAALAGIDEFDPDTADLGLLQQPRLPVLQVAFAGSVPSGGALCVTVEGAPFTPADSTLWVVARGTGAAPAATQGWRVRDVAFLEEAVAALPLPLPGGEFSERSRQDPPLEILVPPLTAAEVAQAADMARSAAGRSGRSPIVWGGALVLAPFGEAALWAEVDALVAAAEQERLRAGDLEVRWGDTRVVLPVLAGRPARVRVGVERAVLAGYELQVAQDTWMPRPQVRRAHDGILVQGRLVAGRFEGSGWLATSEPTRIQEREKTVLAQLQLGDRTLAPATLRVPARGARHGARRAEPGRRVDGFPADCPVRSGRFAPCRRSRAHPRPILAG